jgi:tetratricopeptide (TPR) repeat protein
MLPHCGTGHFVTEQRDAHYNRGLALMYLNRQEEALASFNSAIRLKPGYDLAITQRDNMVRGVEVGRLRG